MDFDDFCEKYNIAMDECDKKNSIKFRRLGMDELISQYMCLYVYNENLAKDYKEHSERYSYLKGRNTVRRGGRLKSY